MVVGSEIKKEEHVEFVSYDGKYPCLCFGKLELKVDGEVWIFSNLAVDHSPFWHSGGTCNYRVGTTQDEWIIDRDELPEELKIYAEEIDEVFNTNVPYGCCGGCL
jgi:hypothetical protein